jgi:hypothetical protein
VLEILANNDFNGFWSVNSHFAIDIESTPHVCSRSDWTCSALLARIARRPRRERVTQSAVMHSVIAMVLASDGASGLVTDESTGTWTIARAARERAAVNNPG